MESGLYVHIPFCQTKCGYCDFYSVPLEGRPTSGLVEQVIAELEIRLAGWSWPISTIFVGGGTPTLLPHAELATLLGAIGRATAEQPIREWTVEANPATVDEENARILVDAGVTRVSMGAQSFFERELAVLERLHCPGDIAPTVSRLRGAGLRSLNVDLIFGIPGQTLDAWTESLSKAIALGTQHLSCYGLTYEPGTPLTAHLRRGDLTACDESLEARMFNATIEVLAAAGFEQYEISNFARPGEQCLHNLIYWRNQPYLGVGPSAAGFDGSRRYKNVPNVDAYVRRMREQGSAEAELEAIDDATLFVEMIMMQLRTNEGLSRRAVVERLGFDPVVRLHDEMSQASAAGWIKVTDTHIRLTPAGRLVANRVILDLIPARTADIALPVAN